jgi:rhamnose transport system permease protein
MPPPDHHASAAAPRRRLGEMALRLRVTGVLSFLVVLGAVFELLSPRFLTAQNLGVIA